MPGRLSRIYHGNWTFHETISWGGYVVVTDCLSDFGAVSRQIDRQTDRQTGRQTNRQAGKQADTYTEKKYMVKKTEKTAQRCNKLSSNIVFSVSLRCLCSWQITSENGRRIKPTYRWLFFLFWSDSVGTFLFRSKKSFGPPCLSSLYLSTFSVTSLFSFRGVYCFKII